MNNEELKRLADIVSEKSKVFLEAQKKLTDQSANGFNDLDTAPNYLKSYVALQNAQKDFIDFYQNNSN